PRRCVLVHGQGGQRRRARRAQDARRRRGRPPAGLLRAGRRAHRRDDRSRALRTHTRQVRASRTGARACRRVARGMVVRVISVAIDARNRGLRDPRARAAAARWIAANALAASRRGTVARAVPHAPAVVELQVDTWGELLAALAATPVLVDATTLPRTWHLG